MKDLIIRSITENDYPFVKRSWLKHFKEHSYFAKAIRNSVYYSGHSKIIDSIFLKSNCQVLIAAHVDEPEVVLGFLVFEAGENTVVHYAYVIDRARRLGVAREIFLAAGIKPPFCYTHKTDDARELAMKFAMDYNPYLI